MLGAEILASFVERSFCQFDRIDDCFRRIFCYGPES